MRLIRNPELRGIIGLVGIAALIGLAMLTISGKITEWTGWRFTLAKPLTSSIVYVSDKNGHPDIWVMSADGADKKALTNDESRDSEPVVSPDGYTIAYLSQHEGNYNQVYAMDSDGSHPHRLTQITGTKSSPSFSADGKSIIFLCGGNVWSVPLNNAHTERLLPTEQQESMEQKAGEPTPFVWSRQSHDGNILAAVRTQRDEQQAYIIGMGEEMPKVIPMSDAPDGKQMIIERLDAAWATDSNTLLLAADSGDGTHMLVVVDISTGQVSPHLTHSIIGHPEWSPDGTKTIVCENLLRKGRNFYVSNGLITFNLDGGVPKKFPGGEPRNPRWSPDGKEIAFTDGPNIRLLNPESGKVATLSDGKSNDSDPSWAPAPAKK